MITLVKQTKYCPLTKEDEAIVKTKTGFDYRRQDTARWGDMIDAEIMFHLTDSKMDYSEKSYKLPSKKLELNEQFGKFATS